MEKKEIDFSKIPEAGAIVDEVQRRHRKGLTNFLHVIGLMGTGKSWACLRLAELISERISGKNKITSENVADDLLKLLKLIRKYKKGDIIIIEEVGVLFSSRRAMSGENVDVSKVFDTLRKKGIILIMNNPISKDLDSRLVRLSSLQIQTMSLNKKECRTILKPLRLQTNPATGKIYYHRLKQDGKDVHRCWIGKPSEVLTEEYEAMKDSFLNELYNVLVMKNEKKKEKVMKELNSQLSNVAGVPIISDNERLRYNYKAAGMKTTEIAKIYGVSQRAIELSIKSYKDKNKKIEKLKLFETTKADSQQIN